MKLHFDMALKVGRFELHFKTFEFKVKMARDLIVFHAKPKKIGFVMMNNKLVFHFAVAGLLADVAFIFNKKPITLVASVEAEVVKVADVVLTDVEKVVASVEAEVVKVSDDIKAVL